MKNNIKKIVTLSILVFLVASCGLFDETFDGQAITKKIEQSGFTIDAREHPDRSIITIIGGNRNKPFAGMEYVMVMLNNGYETHDDVAEIAHYRIWGTSKTANLGVSIDTNYEYSETMIYGWQIGEKETCYYNIEDNELAKDAVKCTPKQEKSILEVDDSFEKQLDTWGISKKELEEWTVWYANENFWGSK